MATQPNFPISNKLTLRQKLGHMADGALFATTGLLFGMILGVALRVAGAA